MFSCRAQRASAGLLFEAAVVCVFVSLHCLMLKLCAWRITNWSVYKFRNRPQDFSVVVDELNVSSTGTSRALMCPENSTKAGGAVASLPTIKVTHAAIS